MSWLDALAQELEDAERRALRRGTRRIEVTDGPRVTVGGRTLLNFSHNDYLGLSRDPEVIEAAREAATRWGAGSGASRMVTGTLALHEELEAELAAFKQAPSALLFPSGYQANLGLLGTLPQKDDVILLDRLAHACLVDGSRHSGAKLKVFPHNDLVRLEELLAASQDARHRWIVLDGVTSMDGDIAPLGEICALAERYDAVAICDDAHGTGVVGATGRGTAEHCGLLPGAARDRLIVVATLSKALGAQGGAVLGPALLREWLLNRARTFIYTTAPAPPAMAAALAALRLIQRESERVQLLQTRAASFREALRREGLDPLASETPIVPVLLGEPEAGLAAQRHLEHRGLLGIAIRPPTVPKGTSRLRLTVSLLHSEADLAAAVGLVKEAVSAATG